MSLFFISCQIGFENRLIAEINEFWFELIDLDGLPTRNELPEFEIMHGGLQFKTLEHLGFQINFFSKIASRVLLRVNRFEARYFDQFEKNLSLFQIEKYLAAGELKIKIESHKSRLNNEKNLIEAAQNALAKKKFLITTEALQTLYIRIDKDMVTLSLDTSGEHLHKRGYAIYRGEAPLRETIAGCMIRYLKEQVNIDANLTLLDPFVGSGTLLFEAISCNQPNLNRHYSWLGFKNAPKLFQSATWQKNFRWFDNQNTPDCFGYDIDENAIANLEKNITEFENVFKDCKLSIKFEVKDSRNINLERSKLNKNSWLIANPPYGIRLAEDNAKEIIESLENIVDGVIILHPTHWNFNFKKLKLLKSDEFSNQGLNLKLSVYKTKISNI